ncbi:MAG: hypothetical protein MUF33_00600 [Candidatus Nanopelagicales bacterium]|jgi:hypothetical protein|nr:hypothetical protein [Candidatus Nanopelagicales bacterium]MCU0296998.1 hypothetical protein [Candidatus Nanopelagicales bacterium]
MRQRLLAVAAGATLLVTGLTPAESATMSRTDVAEAFIAAIKANDLKTAAKYVDAVGPGGKSAVLVRPDSLYNGQSAWDQVTGADCNGFICSARSFPATPEPAWYVLKRDGRYRVVAAAYRESADYLESQGTFGCLTTSRKVRNRKSDWNLVREVPQGTPVWWLSGNGNTNVAVDAGSRVPRKKMIYGFIPKVWKYVSPDCGD